MICARCHERVVSCDQNNPDPREADSRHRIAMMVPEFSSDLSVWMQEKGVLGNTSHLPIYRDWMQKLGAGPSLVLWVYIAASHTVGGGTVALSVMDIGLALYGLFERKSLLHYRHSLVKIGLLIKERVFQANVAEYRINWEGLSELFGGAE